MAGARGSKPTQSSKAPKTVARTANAGTGAATPNVSNDIDGVEDDVIDEDAGGDQRGEDDAGNRGEGLEEEHGESGSNAIARNEDHEMQDAAESVPPIVMLYNEGGVKYRSGSRFIQKDQLIWANKAIGKSHTSAGRHHPPSPMPHPDEIAKAKPHGRDDAERYIVVGIVHDKANIYQTEETIPGGNIIAPTDPKPLTVVVPAKKYAMEATHVPFFALMESLKPTVPLKDPCKVERSLISFYPQFTPLGRVCGPNLPKGKRREKIQLWLEYIQDELKRICKDHDIVIADVDTASTLKQREGFTLPRGQSIANAIEATMLFVNKHPASGKAYIASLEQFIVDQMPFLKQLISSDMIDDYFNRHLTIDGNIVVDPKDLLQLNKVRISRMMENCSDWDKSKHLFSICKNLSAWVKIRWAIDIEAYHLQIIRYVVLKHAIEIPFANTRAFFAFAAKGIQKLQANDIQGTLNESMIVDWAETTNFIIAQGAPDVNKVHHELLALPPDSSLKVLHAVLRFLETDSEKSAENRRQIDKEIGSPPKRAWDLEKLFEDFCRAPSADDGRTHLAAITRNILSSLSVQDRRRTQLLDILRSVIKSYIAE